MVLPQPGLPDAAQAGIGIGVQVLPKAKAAASVHGRAAMRICVHTSISANGTPVILEHLVRYLGFLRRKRRCAARQIARYAGPAARWLETLNLQRGAARGLHRRRRRSLQVFFDPAGIVAIEGNLYWAAQNKR